MNEDKQFDSSILEGDGPPPVASSRAQDSTEAFTDKKQQRTAGLRLFDIWLYPILTNFVVFGMSVGATYLTNHGKPRADGTQPFGWWGKTFYKRGQDLTKGFRSLGMSEETAKNATMVSFSFIDGTFIAPLVKLFEDRREQIGMWLDDMLGTTPDDKSVYAAEPKQTWGTVIEGRVATSAIVVPTAMVLEKVGAHKGFRFLGEKTAQMVERHPSTAKRFSKFNMGDLFSTAYFEAVYTSICTTGLYFISRAFAQNNDKKNAPQMRHHPRRPPHRRHPLPHQHLMPRRHTP